MADKRDDFWDLSKLVPKKKQTAAPFSTKEKTVTVSVMGEDESKSAETKLTIPASAVAEEPTYRTYESGFIKKVTITRLVDKFDFYGNFRKAALLYFDFKTQKCDFVPFYSYMPQYSQFNTAQKNFYFYWRDRVRSGKYIKTDYSYFYLYVYEILNLPDKIEPERGLSMLLDLWIAYRSELPNVDANMALWLQDYCLIYGLRCPMDRIGGFIFDIVNATRFKEYYLNEARMMGDDGTNAMLAYLSDYDWQKGRYAGGDNKEAYRKHMLSAMGRVIDRLSEIGTFSFNEAPTEKVTRLAFHNSLCTHSVKCRLEIEYVPCGKAEELRSSVTAAIRYTENMLRAALSVKSRLSVIGLPDEYKKLIDGYFNGIYDRVNRERIKANIPEYEKMYDAENTGLSINGADEIERASWITTQRLVSEEYQEDEAPERDSTLGDNAAFDGNPDNMAEGNGGAYSEEDLYGLSFAEVRFLRAVLDENQDGVREICRELGEEALAVVERINEAFSDSFGDIVIEGDEYGLNIIEDYKEEIEEWLMKRMK